MHYKIQPVEGMPSMMVNGIELYKLPNSNTFTDDFCEAVLSHMKTALVVRNSYKRECAGKSSTETRIAQMQRIAEGAGIDYSGVIAYAIS